MWIIFPIITIISLVSLAVVHPYPESNPFNYTSHTYDKVNQTVFERTIDTPSIMDLINTDNWEVFSIQQDGITYYDGDRLHNVDVDKDQREKLFRSRPYLIHSTTTHCDNIDLNLTPFVHTLHLVTKEMIEESSHCLFIQRINTRASSGKFKERVIEREISEIRSDMAKSLPIAKKIVAEHYESRRKSSAGQFHAGLAESLAMFNQMISDHSTSNKKEMGPIRD